MSARDAFSFLCAWVADPSAVGAFAPSGGALAKLISSEITAASGPIIELGPGTGVFTQALLDRGIRQQDLTLIEYQSDFVALLKRRFPQARVLSMDAAGLHQRELFPNAPVGAVISGLPLLNMSPRKALAVLTGSFRYMRPGGAFYQFTYAPRCPVPRPFLERLGLHATCVGRALLNMPPASVYRITRRWSSRLLRM